MNKVFIIGLPRTGTTSVCAALLDHGFKVAHTAYTQQTFHLGDVFADTPCYCDYPQLDQRFPDSRFVYLDRALSSWTPSMQGLLQKMATNLGPSGHFNPIIKRCFTDTFELNQATDPLSDEHLMRCYERHQQQVAAYFACRKDCLTLDVSQPGGLSVLLNFLGKSNSENLDFPHLNANHKVSAWRNIKHPNKLNSSASGPNKRRYFDFTEFTHRVN